MVGSYRRLMKSRETAVLRRLISPASLPIVVAACVTSAAVLWGALTPPGAAPDEPSHVAYAGAVVRGDLGTVVSADDDRQRISVVSAPNWTNTFTRPERSVTDFPYPCFATIVGRSADCAPDLGGDTTVVDVPVTVGRYPPLYHGLVGLPTLALSGPTAVYAMRLISAGLGGLLIGAGLWVAAPRRRPWLAAGSMLAFTPSAAHLAGSVNPSGFEIAAAIGLGAGLLGSTTESLDRGRALVLASLAVALGWGRPLGWVLVLLITGLATLLNRELLEAWGRSVRHRRHTVTAGLLGVAAPILYQATVGLPARAASAAGPSTGTTRFAYPGVQHGVEALERNIIEWGLDLVGRFGWYDHAAPGTVLFGWTIAVFGVALFAWIGASSRQRIALIATGVSAHLIVPLAAIMTTINATAYEVRYHLPVAVLVVLGIAATGSMLPAGDNHRRAWVALRVAAVGAPFAMVIGALGSLHRYAFGAEAQLTDLTHFVTRSPAYLPPAEALALASVAALGAIGLGLVLFRRLQTAPAAPTTSEHPSGNR